MRGLCSQLRRLQTVQAGIPQYKARLAMTQGAKAVEFVKEQREDPDKRKAMVASYKESCPECSSEQGSTRYALYLGVRQGSVFTLLWGPASR